MYLYPSQSVNSQGVSGLFTLKTRQKGEESWLLCSKGCTLRTRRQEPSGPVLYNSLFGKKVGRAEGNTTEPHHRQVHKWFALSTWTWTIALHWVILLWFKPAPLVFAILFEGSLLIGLEFTTWAKLVSEHRGPPVSISWGGIPSLHPHVQLFHMSSWGLNSWTHDLLVSACRLLVYQVWTTTPGNPHHILSKVFLK